MNSPLHLADAVVQLPQRDAPRGDAVRLGDQQAPSGRAVPTRKRAGLAQDPRCLEVHGERRGVLL